MRAYISAIKWVMPHLARELPPDQRSELLRLLVRLEGRKDRSTLLAIWRGFILRRPAIKSVFAARLQIELRRSGEKRISLPILKGEPKKTTRKARKIVRKKGGGMRSRGVMGARKSATPTTPRGKKKSKAVKKKKLKGSIALDGLSGIGTIGHGAGAGGGTGSGYGSGMGRISARVPRALEESVRSAASTPEPPPDPISALEGLGDEPPRRVMPRPVPRMAGAGPALEPSKKPALRWVLANVFDMAAAEPRKAPAPAFRAGGRHEVDVLIDVPRKDWLVAEGPAAESLDAKLEPGQAHELSVMFFIPSLGILKQDHLRLPATGPSNTVRFDFVAGAAGSTLEAHISVVKEGRMLQNAILTGRVVADPAQAGEADRLRLELQVVVPGFGGKAERTTFDATLVASRDGRGHAVAAGMGHPTPDTEAVSLFKTPRIDVAAKSIRRTLEHVVADPEAFKGGLESEASTGLLRDLAQHGTLLYEAIGRRLEADLGKKKLDRLQLITADAETFVPLEFVYDLPVPANGAKLCGNWEKALAGRDCPASFHRRNSLGHLEAVCPSGFWSVSKVIERQILERVGAEALEEKAFAIRAEPTPARNRLSPGAALFGWSELMNALVPGASAAVEKALAKFTGMPVHTAGRWVDWAEHIDKRRPALLVLLSHTTEDGPLALEIGKEEGGERSTLGQITEAYVKKAAGDAPVVFLLGCETANADSELYSFAGRFREKGAAVVVGTITPVLGEHSAAVVKGLLEEFAAKDPAGPRSFGQVLLSARRKLLARGELTALCATAYGDSDWLVA